MKREPTRVVSCVRALFLLQDGRYSLCTNGRHIGDEESHSGVFSWRVCSISVRLRLERHGWLVVHLETWLRGYNARRYSSQILVYIPNREQQLFCIVIRAVNNGWRYKDDPGSRKGRPGSERCWSQLSEQRALFSYKTRDIKWVHNKMQTYLYLMAALRPFRTISSWFVTNKSDLHLRRNEEQIKLEHQLTN